MKVLAIVVLLGIALVSAQIHSDPARESFVSWMHKHSKTYTTPRDFEHRFGIWQSNKEIAAQKNNGRVPEVYGVTKFSDLLPSEFREMYLMSEPIVPHSVEGPVAPELESVSLPSSFDWRDKGGVVTPVYNQGQCGSCWAFSTTEAIESAWALAGHTLTKLSMQQIVDCDTSDDGCGGGNPPTAYQYVIGAGGLDSYASYPYVAEDQYCQFKASNVVAKISSWNYVTQSGSASQMMSYMYSKGPLSVCVDASSWQYYNGGVITSSDGCGQSLDHCVMITGWSTQSGVESWNVRNSWGTDWGINGYLYVQRGSDVCGISQEVTDPII
jgi:C1A family cysteine protease